MRFLTRVSVGLVVLVASIAFAPATKADPITIQAGGFTLTNLGNNGGGVKAFDILIGAASSSSHNVNGTGSFGAVLNLLTFKTAFTGPGSAGITDFSFSQDITINGVTKTLNMAGHISIGHLVDNVSIFESGPLTFNFNTFSVTMNVFPTNVDGFGTGDTHGSLKAEFEVRNTNPIPEPATISLLGLGLAGVAAKMRKRRRSRALQSANVAKTT